MATKSTKSAAKSAKTAKPATSKTATRTAKTAATVAKAKKLAAKIEKLLPAAKATKPAKKAAAKAPPPPPPAKAPPPPAVASRADATTLDGRLHKSQVDSPVRAMWDLCADLVAKRGMRRRDVLAKAAEMGIAYYTARTQYQAWFTAWKASGKPQPKGK